MLRASLGIFLAAALHAAQPTVPQFYARTDLYSFESQGIAVGDVNNDGILDIVTSNIGGVFIGNGDGTFRPGIIDGVQGTFLVLADLNGDGNLDFITGSNSLVLTVSFGNGDGTFQTPTNYSLPGQANPYGIVVQDFNGDGLPDVAVTSTEGLLIYFNQGGGLLAYGTTYFSGQKVTAAVSTDIDGDGKPDLAVGVNRGVTFLLGTGSGAFQIGQSFPLSYNAGSIVFADINNRRHP